MAKERIVVETKRLIFDRELKSKYLFVIDNGRLRVKDYFSIHKKNLPLNYSFKEGKKYIYEKGYLKDISGIKRKDIRINEIKD